MQYKAPDHGFDYDYFVIGGGSGGVRSSRIAASYGAKVALAEEASGGHTADGGFSGLGGTVCDSFAPYPCQSLR